MKLKERERRGEEKEKKAFSHFTSNVMRCFFIRFKNKDYTNLTYFRFRL